MPSRDNQNRIRPPSFRAKLSAMKGLSAEEKALFQRIGNLVDVLSYTQRQENNPGASGTRSRKPDARIPVPQNVTTTGTFGGVEVKWDAVDFRSTRGASDGVAFYEVQFSETSTFATFNKIETVGTRVVIKQQTDSNTLFARLRTVSKRGLTSDFTTATGVSTAEAAFLADQDNISPENRTAVLPHPELLGGALDNDGGGSTFTGIGASVGPSPFTLSDEHSGWSSNVDIRHDITFNLHENSEPFPGLEDQRLETVGQEFLEESTFYTFSPNFYIRPQILTGSFTDFFQVQIAALDPTQIDVEFLRYRILDSFYFPEHVQTGILWDASMSTLKF